MITIHNTDALTFLGEMPDNTVDLIVADPPFFKVKMCQRWDRAWDTVADYLAWIGTLCDQWQRVLKPNGSLYVFASPKLTHGVEGEIRKRFHVLNNIRWVKAGRSRANRKADQRRYFPDYESIVFAEQQNADNIAKGEAGYVLQCDRLRGFVFEPLRKYLADEWERAGLKKNDANVACGTASMAGRHFFDRSQWALPTAQHYAAMQAYANRNCNGSGPKYLRREYEYLRREYEDLRRPFFAEKKRPYVDTWQFATVPHRLGKHPCEKPLDMIEHIVMTSSRPGDTVLDCFAGSGVVGKACRNLSRNAVLVDSDPKWCRQMEKALHDQRTPVSHAA